MLTPEQLAKVEAYVEACDDAKKSLSDEYRGMRRVLPHWPAAARLVVELHKALVDAREHAEKWRDRSEALVSEAWSDADLPWESEADCG